MNWCQILASASVLAGYTLGWVLRGITERDRRRDR